MKRIEFHYDGMDDVFVVFEGYENEPFWNRADCGPCFVFTDLTYAKAQYFEKRGDVKSVVHETTKSEYEWYKQSAEINHQQMSKWFTHPHDQPSAI